MSRFSKGVGRAVSSFALAAVLGSIAPPGIGWADTTIVFQQDFANTPKGAWYPPPQYLMRGPLWIEHTIQTDGTNGPVLTTAGLFQGERVVFPPSIDGTQTNLRYDVDFQRIVALVDTAMMWHVNVDPVSHAQRFYQAAVLHGAEPGAASSWRIQLIEEQPGVGRGFTVETLANVEGPTVSPEAWHHMQVRAEGSDHDNFVVSLDGADVVSAQDSTLRSGRVGLRVGLDSTLWDNVSVGYDP